MSPATTTTTASTPVKRACDSCHRRKVKCIGEGTKPCKNCISAGLTCTYNAIPQKKGPKGSRAKVLSELRENQRQSRLISGLQNEYRFEGRNISPAWTKTPGLLSPEVVNGCVDYFFTHLYPSQPILHRQRTQQIVANMDHSVEAYCMVVSLCAYMMIQPNMILPTGIALSAEFGQLSNTTYGHLLLEEVVRVRKSYNYIENPTTMSIITSFFLFGSYFCLDRQNTAWFYLREATTHALVLGMHDEETYKTGDAIETSRRRRLYWLLFVTERAYALRKHRPLTLHSTIQLPTVDEDPTENVHISGFVHLVNLYRPFDDTFIGLWNKVRTGCLPSWLSQLQSQLTEALPTYLESTEVQAVDLHTSQQWLKTMVWQLGISHGFVSNIASYNNTMNWNYPIEISRDLITMSSQFSQQAMEVHGVGLIEKLFDVACTLTDVMSCVPLDPNPFELGPRDYLHRFLTLISTLRGGQSRYLPLLMSKINETLPTAQLGIPGTTTSSFSSAAGHHSAAAAAAAAGGHHQPQAPHAGAHHHQHHPRPPGSDIYDSSTVAGSAPGSHEATPFDSPPHMTIPLRPAHSYGDLKQTSLHTPHPGHAQIPPPYNASPGPHSSYSAGGYSSSGSTGTMTAYPDPVSMTAVGGVTSAQSPAIVLHDLYGLSRPHGDFGE